MSKLKLAILFVIGFLFVFIIAKRTFSELHLTDLTQYNFGPYFGRAIAINNNDIVLVWGSTDPNEPTWHIMLAQNGEVFKDVKTDIGQDVEIPFTNSFNDGGIVVGTVTDNGLSQGFTYDTNTDRITRLGLDFGTIHAKSTSAIAINNKSQILVTFKDDSDCDHIMVWQSPSVYKVLNTGNADDCTIRVFDINDYGYITGYVQESNSINKRAFLLNSATGEIRNIADSSGKYTNIEPKTVNNDNTVVGGARLTAEVYSYPIAFVWTNGSFKSLGTLPGGNYSDAYSVNDSGYVVGESSVLTAAGKSERHGFLYMDNSMIDLGVLDSADIGTPSFGSDSLDISNGGLIVGSNTVNVPVIDPMATVYIPVTYDYTVTHSNKPNKLKKPHMTPTPKPSNHP